MFFDRLEVNSVFVLAQADQFGDARRKVYIKTRKLDYRNKRDPKNFTNAMLYDDPQAVYLVTENIEVIILDLPLPAALQNGNSTHENGTP